MGLCFSVEIVLPIEPNLCYNLGMPEKPNTGNSSQSSFDNMRALGSIPGQEIQKVPPAMKMVSGSSAKMLEEHQKPWKEQLAAGGISPSVEQSARSVDQGGGDDDKDPNRDRLEHEMRMQEMYGEGRGAYMGEFAHGIRDLKKIKDKLKEAQTDVTIYDEATKVLFDRERDLRDENGDVTFLESKNVTEAQARLQKQSLTLQELISTGILNTDPRDKGTDKQNKKRLERDVRRDLKEAEKTIHLPELLDQEVEKTRERLADSYVNIMHSSLNELNTLSSFLEKKKNPYPYDSRWAMQFFEQGLDQVNDKLRNKSRYEEEGLALLKMLKRDLIWANAAARVNEAMGPAYELYFDGELELSRLRSPHTELLADDFVHAFQKEIPGSELTADEKTLTQATLGKIKDVGENGKYEKLHKEGLREVAIEYQDQYGYWLYAAVGAGQRNLEKGFGPGDNEAGDHYMDVNEVTSRFLNELLDAKRGTVDKDGKPVSGDLIYKDENGKEYRVKKTIFNPFCMSRNDQGANQGYMLLMHELVVNGQTYRDALNKINSGMGSVSQAETDTAISELVKKIHAEADKRAQKWESLEEENPYDRLGFTVLRNLNNIERGTLASGDLGWQWQYEEVSAQKIKNDTKGDFIELGGNPKAGTPGEKRYKSEMTPEEWAGYTHIMFDGGNRDGNKFYYVDHSGATKIKKEILKSAIREKHGEFIFEQVVHGEVNRLQFNKDASGKITEQFFVKRVSELGSIYDNHDITTVQFWAKHLVDYDKMADTRSTLMFPTIGSYRARWESEPPYFRPELSEFAAKDTLLLSRLDKLLSDNNPLEHMVGRKRLVPGKEGWQPQEYGRFDDKARQFIKDNVWAFVTPWLNEPGKSGANFNLAVPVFLPTYIPDINFWRSVTLEGPAAKLSDFPGKSMWEGRMAGKALSSFNWSNMDEYKYSWSLVNMDQMERWFGPWVTPHALNRATKDEVEKHLQKPGGFAGKEEGKRKRLSLRAGILDAGVVRATSSAQNKVLASVPFSQVMGIEVVSLGQNLGPNTIDLGDKLDKWRKEWITPWVNAELDMPTTVRGVRNYPGTSAMSAIFTYLQTRRIVASAVMHAYGQAGDVNASIDRVEDSFK